jgi:excisionase family DNA binding protein
VQATRNEQRLSNAKPLCPNVVKVCYNYCACVSLVTITEAAAFLSVDRSTVWRMIRDGRLAEHWLEGAARRVWIRMRSKRRCARSVEGCRAIGNVLATATTDRLEIRFELRLCGA